jgi:preprotein translocase subunit SecE
VAKNEKPAKKPRVRKTETFREQAQKSAAKEGKPKRRSRIVHHAKRPFKAAANVGRKEYHPVKTPDNRFGRFLGKRRHWIPKYFREAWGEVRQVTWPSRRQTWKLTFAVFAFAFVFGLAIAIVDFGLDKVFKRLILN